MDKLTKSFSKACGAGFTAVFTYFFGGIDAIMGILLAFIAIDYMTGILAAIYTKTLSSEVGYKGIIKKVAILCIVSISHLAGQATGIDTIRSLAIGFYIANEGISIIENAGRMDIGVPDRVKDVLIQLKNKKKSEK